MRLLLVEDEQRLADNICETLREFGFAVDHAADGITGYELANEDVFDAIILDLMLPGRSGQSILHGLRQKKRRTPILILTAQEGKESIVELLNSGADDYLAKPFELQELIARVKALIRRSMGSASPILNVNGLELNTVAETVRHDRQTIELSPSEYRILEYLALRRPAIISKRELVEHLYNFDWDHHSNVVEAHVSNLRKKLCTAGAEDPIRTIRNRGYKLKDAAIYE